jgi:hypothetical protein
VLSRQLDDLEPTLHGYRLKEMGEQFDAKSAEIMALNSKARISFRTMSTVYE